MKDYSVIIENLCKFNNTNTMELIEILKIKDNKYLILLMLKKYGIFEDDIIKELINVQTKKSVNYNLRRAEERFLINRDFRDKYFELERRIEKIV